MKIFIPIYYLFVFLAIHPPGTSLDGLLSFLYFWPTFDQNLLFVFLSMHGT